MKNIIITLCFTLTCTIGKLNGQLGFIKHYTVNEGLPSNDIIKFEKDLYGFLWIGTLNGISRFDGSNFTKFHNLGKEENGLQGNSIYSILATQDTSVWVSTYGGGISIYKYRSNTFNTLQKGNKSILENRVMGLIEVDSTSIIAHYRGLDAHSGGLTILNNKGDVIKHQLQDVIQEDGFKYRFQDHSLHEKKLFTSGYQLYEIDLVDFSFSTFEYPFRINRYSDVTAINHITDKTMLVGGINGLYKLNIPKKEWDAIDKNINVKQIVTLGQSQLILTRKQILSFDPKTGKTKTILSASNLASVSSDLILNRIFVHNNLLWIGSNIGLWSVDIKQSNISRQEFQIKNKKIQTPIPLSKDQKNKLHYISRNGVIFKEKNGQTEFINSIAGVLHDMTPFSEDFKSWIFASDSGLYKYNLESSKVEDLVLKYNISALKNKSIWSVYKEGEQVWLGTKTNGLYKYDISTDSLINFRNNPTNKLSLCFDRYLFDITKGPDGFLWISTDKGLSILDPKNDEWIRYPGIIDTLSEYIIHHSARGEYYMWIGTRDHGLYRYDINTHKTKIYTLKDGLPYTGVNRVICKNGLVFCSTREGLAVINEKTDEIDILNEKDGLKRKGLYYARLSINEKEDLIVSSGNDNYIYKFEIQGLFKNSKLPDININQLNVHGGKQSKQFYYPSKKITLEADQNNFLVSFNSIDFDNNPIEYRYIMKNYDSDWIYSGTRQNANYAHISGGEYSFIVESSIHGGQWGQQKSIEIQVLRYWYNNLWFYLILSLLLLGLIYYLYSSRIQKIKLDQKYQALLAETEMKVLRSQMNPHFIFNALNSIKSFIVENDQRNATNYLNKFSKLIRLILNHSRSEQVPLEHEVQAIRLYIEMESLRFNSFDFEMKFDEKLQLKNIFVQPMIIQPFLENAIWHGLLHKKEGSRLLKMNILKSTNNQLLIRIIDNGVGRKKAQELKSKSAIQKKSYGMRITEDRINLASNSNESKFVTIIDLFENDVPSGTEVKLILPFTSENQKS